jgi:hypothetical protein
MVSCRRFTGLVALGLLVVAGPARAAEDAQYFPADTQAVITLNVKQILSSPLVKKDQDKIKAGLQSIGEAQTVLESLGFNPLTDLDTVTVSLVGASDQEKVTLLVRGKFNLDKFKAKAKEVAKDMPDVLKIHQAGTNSIYEVNAPGQQRPIFLGLMDATTIVGAPTKEQIAEAFDIQSGKKKVALKKELVGLLKKAETTKQSLTLVGLGSALGNEVPYGDKIDYISGGITLSDKLTIEINIETKDADAAKGLKTLVDEGINQGKSLVSLFAMQQKELAPLTEMLDQLKVTDKGKSVSIKGEVTKEALEKIEKAK